MRRHLFGSAGIVAALIVAGCAEDPTDPLRGSVVRVQPSRNYVEMSVGQSLQLAAQAFDEQGNAVRPLPTVTSNNTSVATIVVDDVQSGNPVPETNFTLNAVGYGNTTLTVESGSQSSTITVVTYPRSVTLTAPATLRSGSTVQVMPNFFDTGGNAITPQTEVAPLAWSSSSASTATVDATGLVAGFVTGPVTITAVTPNGVSGAAAISIIAGLPTAAALAAPSFGALGAGGTATQEVVITDAQGNVNNLVSDLVSVTASSSDPAVATVATEIDDIMLPSGEVERHLRVTATAVGGGTATVSGSVETAAGTLVFADAPVTVLAPVITPAAPAGLPGSVVTINGMGLAATGFTTLVLVDGNPVGNLISVSETAIMAQMPTLMAGTYELRVSVGGVESDADSWSQTADYIEAATEPNDDLGQETPISAGFEFSGTADQATDFSDLFEFTVTEDNVVIDLELTWGDGNDLDALIYAKGAQSPGTYTFDDCGFALSSLAIPETGTCQLGAAGTYTLEILHYGPGPTTYTIKGTIQ